MTLRLVPGAAVARAAVLETSTPWLDTYHDPACAQPATGLFLAADGTTAAFHVQAISNGDALVSARVSAVTADHPLTATVVSGWQLDASANQPGPRYASAMAPDPIDGGVLLYGGAMGNGSVVFADFWRYAGDTWHLLAGTPPPGPVGFAKLVWDPAHGRHLLIGGIDSAVSLVPSIWQYADSTWSTLTLTSGTWVPHAGPGAVYDPVRQVVVIFAGQLAAGTNDDAIYELDGTDLIGPLRPAMRPTPRIQPMCDYHPTLAAVACYGGDTGSDYSDELWTWDGAWTIRCGGCTGRSRSSGGMAFHDVLGDLVIFNGWDGDEIAGTSLWNGNGFSVFDAVAPAQRDTVGWTFDPIRHAIVMYGGNGDSCDGVNHYCDETWLLY